MNKVNIGYDKNSNFNLVGKVFFIGTSVGIENIFLIASANYHGELDYLNNPYGCREKIYVGNT
jgi:hypothetical protein